MSKRFLLIILVLIIFLALAISFAYLSKKSASNALPSVIEQQSSLTANKITDSFDNLEQKSLLQPPLIQALERVTKKPFGIKISPQSSPVSPERFAGYHTGVDFEILPGEENVAVPVFAVCAGPLIYKQQASGYGGVAIQQCALDKQIVTVLYGHLQLTSVAAKLNTDLFAGDQIGILGKGYGNETSGERKHLHLGIHRGEKIDLRGYVQSARELENWLSIIKILNL